VRIIFDSIEEAITVTDLQGVIIDANQTTVRNSGYSTREELIGHSGLEFISEKDRERCAKDISEAKKTGAGKWFNTLSSIRMGGNTKDGLVVPC
jgi:PAS domain S-box-containing protein